MQSNQLDARALGYRRPLAVGLEPCRACRTAWIVVIQTDDAFKIVGDVDIAIATSVRAVGAGRQLLVVPADSDVYVPVQVELAAGAFMDTEVDPRVSIDLARDDGAYNAFGPLQCLAVLLLLRIEVQVGKAGTQILRMSPGNAVAVEDGFALVARWMRLRTACDADDKP